VGCEEGGVRRGVRRVDSLRGRTTRRHRASLHRAPRRAAADERARWRRARRRGTRPWRRSAVRGGRRGCTGVSSSWRRVRRRKCRATTAHLPWPMDGTWRRGGGRRREEAEMDGDATRCDEMRRRCDEMGRRWTEMRRDGTEMGRRWTGGRGTVTRWDERGAGWRALGGQRCPLQPAAPLAVVCWLLITPLSGPRGDVASVAR
jgi:hypothetical protein